MSLLFSCLSAAFLSSFMLAQETQEAQEACHINHIKRRSCRGTHMSACNNVSLTKKIVKDEVDKKGKQMSN